MGGVTSQKPFQKSARLPFFAAHLVSVLVNVASPPPGCPLLCFAELRHTHVHEIHEGGLWQSKAARVFSRAAEVNCLSRSTSLRGPDNSGCFWMGKRCRKVWRLVISQLCFSLYSFLCLCFFLGPQDFPSRLLQDTKCIKMIRFLLFSLTDPLCKKQERIRRLLYGSCAEDGKNMGCGIIKQMEATQGSLKEGGCLLCARSPAEDKTVAKRDLSIMDLLFITFYEGRTHIWRLYVIINQC